MGLKTLTHAVQLFPEISWAAVDTNPDVLDGQNFQIELYHSIEEGLDCVKPDFVYNATLPSAHPHVCFAAFERKIPVLCEKPLADTFLLARDMVKRAKEKAVPFMVAENYRRYNTMRTIKRELDKGTIGTLTAIHVSIFINYYTGKLYFHELENPLLRDVIVHYADLFRYFAGCEAVNVYAKNWNPVKRYPGNAATALICEMASGVVVTLHGSVVTPGEENQWAGFWRFEGTKGSLHMNREIRTVFANKSNRINEKKYEGTIHPLEDFLTWIKGGPQPETIAEDYLRSEHIIACAEESFHKGKLVQVNFDFK